MQYIFIIYLDKIYSSNILTREHEPAGKNCVTSSESGEKFAYLKIHVFIKFINFPAHGAAGFIARTITCLTAYTYAIYRMSQEICTRFCCALFCCGYAIVQNEFTWSIYPYSSGLLCWHWGNRYGKPDGYGKISQCITTTKHSKGKTVCIFLGIYCMICPITLLIFFYLSFI